jgi:hypothetical protein
MKFKMQYKQNQLIERITNRHLVVSVDIAHQVHVARAVYFREFLVLGRLYTVERHLYLIFIRSVTHN